MKTLEARDCTNIMLDFLAAKIMGHSVWPIRKEIKNKDGSVTIVRNLSIEGPLDWIRTFSPTTNLYHAIEFIHSQGYVFNHNFTIRQQVCTHIITNCGFTVDIPDELI